MKKPPLPVEQLSKDSQKLFDILNEGPDLAAALIGANYLDQCLNSMLDRYMVQGKTSQGLLDPVNGLLGTFAARMKMAYALGLLNKPVLIDLQLIAEIRNAVAHHHLDVGFDSPEIREKIEKLRYLATLDGEVGLRGVSNDRLSLARRAVGLRDKFNLTVAMLSQQLLVTGLGLKPRKRSEAFVQTVSQGK